MGGISGVWDGLTVGPEETPQAGTAELHSSWGTLC